MEELGTRNPGLETVLKENEMNKLIEFLKAAWVELKKVSWPSQKEVIASTVVVVLVSLLLMLYIGVLDLLLSKLVKIIFG